MSEAEPTILNSQLLFGDLVLIMQINLRENVWFKVWWPSLDEAQGVPPGALGHLWLLLHVFETDHRKDHLGGFEWPTEFSSDLYITRIGVFITDGGFHGWRFLTEEIRDALLALQLTWLWSDSHGRSRRLWCYSRCFFHLLARLGWMTPWPWFPMVTLRFVSPGSSGIWCGAPGLIPGSIGLG